MSTNVTSAARAASAPRTRCHSDLSLVDVTTPLSSPRLHLSVAHQRKLLLRQPARVGMTLLQCCHHFRSLNSSTRLKKQKYTFSQAELFLGDRVKNDSAKAPGRHNSNQTLDIIDENFDETEGDRNMRDCERRRKAHRRRTCPNFLRDLFIFSSYTNFPR